MFLIIVTVRNLISNYFTDWNIASNYYQLQNDKMQDIEHENNYKIIKNIVSNYFIVLFQVNSSNRTIKY